MSYTGMYWTHNITLYPSDFGHVHIRQKRTKMVGESIREGQTGETSSAYNACQWNLLPSYYLGQWDIHIPRYNTVTVVLVESIYYII